MHRKGLISLEMDVESVPYGPCPEELGNQTYSGPGRRNGGWPAACRNGCSQVPPTRQLHLQRERHVSPGVRRRGKLGGRGPLPSHPHPDVAVRLDGSHFEETEAQRGRGAWPRVTQLAESESRALHSRLSCPQEAMLSVGPPVPGDPCLPVFQVQSSNSVLSRRAGFPNHLPRLTLHPPAQSSRPRMGLGI